MTESDGVLTREAFLKRAALRRRSGVLARLGAGSAGAAGSQRLGAKAERAPAGARLGRVRGEAALGAVRGEVPGQPPQFTFMTNEANALAKLNAGLQPDVVRPYVGYVKDFADSGFFQPWTRR